MKKLIILTIPFLGAACTKNYSCKCITTASGVDSEKMEYVKGTKSEAKDKCEAKSKTYNVIYKVKCELI